VVLLGQDRSPKLPR